MVLGLGLYLGGNRYHLRFESLARRVALPREASKRMPVLAELVGQYAARIEAQLREHPFNWFNFYDFWA